MITATMSVQLLQYTIVVVADARIVAVHDFPAADFGLRGCPAPRSVLHSVCVSRVHRHEHPGTSAFRHHAHISDNGSGTCLDG